MGQIDVAPKFVREIFPRAVHRSEQWIAVYNSTVTEPLRIYGVARRVSGRFFTFILHQKDTLPRYIVVKEQGHVPLAEATQRVNELLAEYEVPHSEPSKVLEDGSLTAGSLAWYNDGDPHVAIVLESGPIETLAVFCTSRPDWNAYARLATPEEVALIGLPKKHGIVTHLAPVLRPTGHFDAMPRPAFPAYRVEELRREFSRERAG